MNKTVKGLFFIGAIMLCIAAISGCTKKGRTLTINPYMTATIGTYTFSAENVFPATDNSQISDTGTTLIITGQLPTTGEMIRLTIAKYNANQGTYSIAEGQATAEYLHGPLSIAEGGVVAVTKVTSNTIIGYFSFNTFDGYNVLNGTYCVGRPY